MIQLKNISLSFGHRKLFDGVSFTIDPRDRIGLVGLNGAGKSTMLKIIAKEQSVDDGTILVPKDLNIAYMSQETVLLTDNTVIEEALTAFGDIELEDLARLTAEAKSMLDGLGFSAVQINGPVSALSVGWKMRLVLTKLLLRKADFYLFDEPTNHLDIIAKDWFIPFLQKMSAGFLLVCHEQYVLDELCTKIIDLSRAHATVYQGNYSAFVEKKEAAEERHLSAYLLQQKMIAQKKETIERFKATASKAKMAQSMMKELDKIERLEPPQNTGRSLHIPLPAVERSGRVTLTVENVGYDFGDKTIFKNVSFTIERGEKVAIVSANGVGKTTLLNVIAGVYPKQKGTVTFGHNVTHALFHQDPNRSLNLNNSIHEEALAGAVQKSEQEIRTLLGSFLFSGDDIKKKIKVLSGGEKNRVAMVKVLLQPANFLILDEPTNHLDMPSKQVLLTALKQYQGTLLFVSHDHMFLNELPTRILELSQNGIESFPGNYHDYRYHKEQNASSNNSHEGSSSTEKQSDANKKNDFAARKLISTLESKIAKNEQRTVLVQNELFEHEYGSELYTKFYDELMTLTKQHQTLLAEWESLQTTSSN